MHGALAGRVSRMTALVALGTHAAMDEQHLGAHLGYPAEGLEAAYPGLTVINHEWWDPETFVSLGTIPAERIAELSEGRLREAVSLDVRVLLNRAVVEHDVALVVGPVFPHEVVGFSGGNKYFFPGVSGQEVIDLSHWLGALITSADIIGTRGITPVRALINEAASMIPSDKLAICVVVKSGTDRLHSVSFGDPQSSWAAAAEVSAETHVRYLDAPVAASSRSSPRCTRTSGPPPRASTSSSRSWPTAARSSSTPRTSPRFAAMHPEINEIGYHCRDYFVKQWDRFKDVHWGVLAHSTHLRGAGTYDEELGERCRLTVTLATGIPEDVVRAANLNYRDPATVDLAALEADPDTFVVPQAGEVLFRLR